MGRRRWCLGKCEKPSTTECTEEHREKQHQPRLTTHSATLSAGYGHEGTQRKPLRSGRRVIGSSAKRSEEDQSCYWVLAIAVGYEQEQTSLELLQCWIQGSLVLFAFLSRPAGVPGLFFCFPPTPYGVGSVIPPRSGAGVYQSSAASNCLTERYWGTWLNPLCPVA
jgi:hypothetical protein